MLALEMKKHAPDTGGAGGGAGTGATGQTDGQGAEQSAPQTWETFVEALPAEVRALYDAHVTGLRNAVQATRGERDTLKARFDAVIAALDGKDPTAVKAQLETLRTDLDTANQRAGFLEDAVKPEIGCRNPRLAWMVAKEGDLFDRQGRPDWPAIKTAAPEIFGPAVPRGNTGSGTGTQPPARQSMNDWIRTQAGR